MFLAFAFSSYHPRGGWHDVLGEYTTLEEAMTVVTNRPEGLENWHIVDTTTRSIVKNGKVSQ